MYFLSRDDPGQHWFLCCGPLSLHSHPRAGSSVCELEVEAFMDRGSLGGAGGGAGWLSGSPWAPGQEGLVLLYPSPWQSNSLSPSLILPVSACALLCSASLIGDLSPFSGASLLQGTEFTERGGLGFPQQFWCGSDPQASVLSAPNDDTHQRASPGLPWEERLYPLP